MWQYREYTDANRAVAAYISKQYYHFLQISAIYPNMEGKNCIISIVQITIYFLILFYHLGLLVLCTIDIYGFNMVLFSQNIHFVLLIQIGITLETTWLWKNYDIFFLHNLLLHNFYDYQEPAIAGEEILRSVMETEILRLTLIPMGVALAAGVVMVAAPIIDFRAGTFDFEGNAYMFDYELPLPYTKYPFNVKVGFGYYIATLGQLSCALVLAFIISGSGLLFIHLSENLILQLKILLNSLDNIESRIENLHSKLFGGFDRNSTKSLLYDSRYNYCHKQCLKKNFEHHQLILKAFYVLEDIFSIPIGSSFMTGTIVIALSLISAGSAQELPGTTMSSMILCAVEVGYMFLLSMIGQRFADLSIELRSIMYNTKWYMSSKEIKRSLMIFQEMTLKPLTMKAAKIVPANMETFSTVMNGAYSYYNLVNAFD